jgi:hypothetical protein
LYADEVIVEDPTRYLKDKDNIPEIVDALIRMRPLAKAGLIHFFRFSNRLHHPSRSFNITAVDAEKLRLLPDGTELIREMDRLSAILRSYDFELLIFQVRMALGISLVLARDNPRSFNVLARSAEESVLLPVGLYNAALSSSDTRNICMARLASLTLPKLDGKAVWSVRKSSDEFGEWRQALGVAMREIDAISSDDEAWQSEARGIFEWELRSIRDKLNRTTQKSSALSVAKVGTINMTYSAVGALTGFALGGNIGTALAGAASAKGTEVIVSYLRGLKERRQGKAILDLALAFHSNDD